MSYYDANQPPQYPPSPPGYPPSPPGYPPQGYPQQPYPYAPQPGSGKDGVATASLVVGIISLISICGAFVPFVTYCFIPIAFLTAAAGIVLGFIGLGAPQKAGQARIGLLISGGSLLLQICVIIVMVALLGSSIFMMDDPGIWEDLLRELEGF